MTLLRARDLARGQPGRREALDRGRETGVGRQSANLHQQGGEQAVTLAQQTPRTGRLRKWLMLPENPLDSPIGLC